MWNGFHFRCPSRRRTITLREPAAPPPPYAQSFVAEPTRGERFSSGSLAKHRSHSIAFNRQVVREYLAGETLHGLVRRHNLSRTLIRI